jgi:hypothetical protein
MQAPQLSLLQLLQLYALHPMLLRLLGCCCLAVWVKYQQLPMWLALPAAAPLSAPQLFHKLQLARLLALLLLLSRPAGPLCQQPRHQQEL